MNSLGKLLAAMEIHPAEDVIGFLVKALCPAIWILDEHDIKVDGDFISASEQFGCEDLHTFEPEGMCITEYDIPGDLDGVPGCPLDVFASGAADGGDSGEEVWVGAGDIHGGISTQSMACDEDAVVINTKSELQFAEQLEEAAVLDGGGVPGEISRIIGGFDLRDDHDPAVHFSLCLPPLEPGNGITAGLWEGDQEWPRSRLVVFRGGDTDASE